MLPSSQHQEVRHHYQANMEVSAQELDHLMPNVTPRMLDVMETISFQKPA